MKARDRVSHTRWIWSWVREHPVLTGILLYLLIGRFAWWPLLSWTDTTTAISSDAVLISLESIPTGVKMIAWLGWGVLLLAGFIVFAVWLLIRMFTLLGRLA